MSALSRVGGMEKTVTFQGQDSHNHFATPFNDGSGTLAKATGV